MTWRTANRKDRLRAAGTTGWAEQAAAKRILHRDQYQCYLRGSNCIGHATEVDHIRSLARGGTDTDDNKAAICKPCHKAKTISERARPAPLRRPPEHHPGLR
jgi:5-methylcytosine-specific restriction protein A